MNFQQSKLLGEKKNAPVVMLSTSETTTTGMFPVLPYTSVPGRHVATMLAGLAEMGRHS